MLRARCELLDEDRRDGDAVPVLNRDGQVLGVIQVSRKGLDISMAGADFTLDNLNTLEKAAHAAADAAFMKTA